MRRTATLLLIVLAAACLVWWTTATEDRGETSVAPASAAMPETPARFDPELALPGESGTDHAPALLDPHVGDRVAASAAAESSRLLVRVRDERGEPLADVRVALGSIGTESATDLAEDLTDAAGACEFPELLAGAITVRATKTGYATLDLPELRLPRTDPLEISLPDAPGEGWIDILVLDPHEKPFPHAQLQLAWRCEGNSRSWPSEVDAAGRARHQFTADCPIEIQAWDRERKNGTAEARGLSRHVGQVILKLSELRAVTLRVVDELDRPIPWFDTRVVDARETTRIVGSVTSDAQTAGGRWSATIRIPELACFVIVESEGRERVELRPYSASDAPEEIVARLRPLPGVRGRVLADGRPYLGARVSVHEAFPSAMRARRNDLPVRSSSSAAASGVSGEGGAFALTLRESGSFYVRAVAGGLAPAEIGPFECDPSRGLAGLELHLTQGGRIEGIVTPRAGEPVDSLWVAASRGDGLPRGARPDASGRYAFERLTPGLWLVRIASRDPEDPTSFSESRSSTSGKPADGIRELPHDVVVRAGATSYFDIDRTAPIRITGTIGPPAPPAGTWRAILRRPAAEWSSAVDVRPDGGFEIDAETTGEHRLTFETTALGAQSVLRLDAVPIEVRPGLNAWETAVPTGTLELRGESWAEIQLRVQTVSKLTGRTRPTGAGTFAGVPAGNWTASVRVGEREWKPFAQRELAPGGIAVLELP